MDLFAFIRTNDYTRITVVHNGTVRYCLVVEKYRPNLAVIMETWARAHPVHGTRCTLRYMPSCTSMS